MADGLNDPSIKKQCHFDPEGRNLLHAIGLQQTKHVQKISHYRFEMTFLFQVACFWG